MSSLYREQLEKWLSLIHVDARRVLDVGGGQLPISKRVASWSVKECLILDNDAQYKPDIFINLNHEVTVFHKETIKTLDGYDALFCLEVMEYIYDPVTAHKNLAGFLKKDGVAYISYPTWYPLHNPPGIDYLRYTKNAIEKYLSLSGFKTWEITPRIATDGAHHLSSFYSAERMRPMKGSREIFDVGYMVRAIKG